MFVTKSLFFALADESREFVFLSRLFQIHIVIDMARKHKSGKKRNPKRSNRPSSLKSEETKQIPKPTASLTSKAEIRQIKSSEEMPALQQGKRNEEVTPWRKRAVKVVKVFIFLFTFASFFGFPLLWPRVVIDASPAVDNGILSYQFTFANQCCYPLKVNYTHMSLVGLSWPINSTSGQEGSMDGIGIKKKHADVHINGNESITLKCDAFRVGTVLKVNEGSKVIVHIAYRLPLINIKKTDSALFVAAKDNSGNSIWIKKSMGRFASYKDKSVIFFDPANPQSEIY